MLCSFFWSRRAGNGRACYVRSFGAMALVTVGYALFVFFWGGAVALVTVRTAMVVLP